MGNLEWLHSIVPEFGELSDEELDAIGHFTLLWSLFEALALGNSASPNTIQGLVDRWESQGKLNVDDFEAEL